MKKIVVLVTLIVLLAAVSAVYADTSEAAWEAQSDTATSQIDLSVGADNPFDDWNCPTAVFQLPTKCIFP
jgi:opacity protein-like surface antigen